MISTTVRPAIRPLVPTAERARLVRQLGRAMRAAGVGEAELSLALVDDAEIRALNKQWRRKDKPTDVLSFSQSEGEPVAVGDEGPGQQTVLGDVIISVETARAQAEAGRRPLEAELLHLAVHGLAHLLGYDHATVRQEQVMFGFEAELRAQATAGGRVGDVPRPPMPSSRERPRR